MKEILFKILVVLLSPVYFMFWIFANIMGLAMEIGQPILDVVLEKVEKILECIEDYFYRLNGPDEDIKYIKNIKQELLED